MDIMLESRPCTERDIRRRCCCNCGHDIRVPDKNNSIRVDHNECDIDGHYIGYIQCFEGWCKHWKKDKFESQKGDTKC